jgi:hypothetical protein
MRGCIAGAVAAIAGAVLRLLDDAELLRPFLHTRLFAEARAGRCAIYSAAADRSVDRLG